MDFRPVVSVLNRALRRTSAFSCGTLAAVLFVGPAWTERCAVCVHDCWSPLFGEQ